MTTIDDARKALQRSLDCEVYPIFEARHVEATDLRTLLAHTADYDALKGRLEEATKKAAESLGAGMEEAAAIADSFTELDFAQPNEFEAGGITAATNIASAIRRRAAFLDREKEAGRG